MKKKLLGKLLSTIALPLALIIFLGGITIYNKTYKKSIFTKTGETAFIYIPTGSSFEDVWDTLTIHLKIKNEKALLWVMEKKNYKNKVRPGRYKIKNGLSNNDLTNQLRAGWQEPIMVTFNNVRTPKELAEKVGQQIETTSEELLQYLTNDSLINSYGYTLETFPCMFIPNTYEFFWTTKAEGFIKRMKKEHNKFWTEKNLEKARSIDMTPIEVATLASIVDQETAKSDEKPKIAGVYINRLKKGIRLGADPTVKFAVGDFTIKRVLKKHLQINSPYNTYKNNGLPPGPICYPSISGIKAVLNYEQHKYIYFCAKEDFSGYHNFATNLRDHNRNAVKYRRALDKRRIYR